MSRTNALVPRVCTLVGGGGEFRSAAESSERVDSRASNGVSTPVKVRASSNSPLKPSPPSTARPTGTAASSTMHPFIPQLALHQLRSPSVGRSSSTPLTESSTPHPFGGLGESGFVDGPLSSCRFSDPTSIALQLHPVSRAVEAVLVADTGNHAVRRVDLVRGSVTTVACRTTMRPTPPTDANEVCADHVAAGASTAAVAASPFPILLPLHSPADLLLDPSSNGSYLLVADSGNHIIRKLQLLDGIERKRGTSVRWAGGGGDLAAGVTKLGEENEGDEEEAEEEEDQTVTGSSNGTTTDDTPPPTGRRRMRESDAALESSSRPGTASTSRSSSSHLPSASTVSALSARFSHPSGMCWDTSQRVWLCDRVNGKVKRVDTTGRVTSFAARTRDELGVQASRPQCIIQDARGDIVFTDRENHCVKKIAPDGTVFVLAGCPRSSGFRDGPALAARFSSPFGLACDNESNLIFVADSDNHAIRVITPTGVVRTIAGAGAPVMVKQRTAAAGSSGMTTGRPSSAASHRSYTNRAPPAEESVSFAEEDPTLIRDLEAEEGYVNGPGGLARFFRPRGLAIASGVLYIVDVGNHCLRTIKVDGDQREQHGEDDTEAAAFSLGRLAPTEPLLSSRQQSSSVMTARPSTAGLNRHASVPAFAASSFPSTSRPSTARPLSSGGGRSRVEAGVSSPYHPPTPSRLHQKAASSVIALEALDALAPPISVVEWSRVDVAFWLLGLSASFEQYVSAFHEARVDGARLLEPDASTEAFLAQLGVTSKMHRRTIRREILQLANASTQEEEAEEADSANEESSGARSHTASRVGSAASIGRAPALSRPGTASGWRGSPTPPTGPILPYEDTASTPRASASSM